MDAGAPLQLDVVPIATPPGAPLAVELVPAPDPWEVARRLCHRPGSLFLDSADRHVSRGQYSYIATDVSYEWRPAARGVRQKRGLWALAENLGTYRPEPLPELPPFQGGLGFALGYDLNRTLEKIPETRYDEFGSFLWAGAQYDWVVSFDHRMNRAWLVSTGCGLGIGSDDRIAFAKSRLAEVLHKLRCDPAPPLPAPELPRQRNVQVNELCPQHPLPGFPHVTSNFSREDYEAAVRRAVEYIHAGDCFQVNLSQRLLAPLREHSLELYGRLRRLNPAPFAGYFDLGDFQVLSASPERFLRVDAGGEIETRPIKGTRPRGTTVQEDAALVRELASSAKDIAENVMIVDLLRNDIGKVAEYGSVRVPRLCEVETFRYVHHLVSEVRGKLRPGVGPLDLLAAAFPGGSVTGAPKVRAMEIIAELEPTARGPYCGCLGWIGFNGAMDTNILIRTFTAGRGWVQFPVGGGIVAESDPAREYEETLHKAAGLLRALL